MDEDERRLFARTVRDVVEDAAGSDLGAALGDLGWSEALAADRRTAVGVLFEVCGRLGGRAPLDDVVAAELRPGSGLDRAGVVLPPLGGATPPGARQDGRLVVRGVVPGHVTATDTVLVAVGRAGTVELHPVPTADLELGPALPLATSLDWHEVRWRGPVGAPVGGDVTAAWERAITLGRLALAHQLVGASRRLVELARDHAVDRVQFGRPIAAFQAVRHRLADSLVVTEAAAESVDAAWELATPLAARAAKALAGRGARRVGRHAQQVLAGMGFTAEHPLPAVVTRTLVLDQALGSAAALTRGVGEELASSGRLPAPLPL